MKHRFREGDLARLKYVRNGQSDFWRPGAVIEVMEICNCTDFDGNPYDYVVRMFNGGKAFPIDNQLEPLDTESVLSKLSSKACV